MRSACVVMGVLILLLVAGGQSAQATPVWRAADSGVEADDEQDRFVGWGQAILPTTITATVRVDAARCIDCRWKVSRPCLSDSGVDDAGCRGTILGCPQGREIRQVWRARPGQEFVAVGTFCPISGEVTLVADVQKEISEGFSRHVPRLTPECQPPRGAVTGIPVHCWSGQPGGTLTWTDEVAGYEIRTSVKPAWQWTFLSEDGRRWESSTSDPGGPYPQPGISHVFEAVGMHRIRVLARWKGEFSVSGLAAIPIDEVVWQEAALEVPTSSAVGVIRR